MAVAQSYERRKIYERMERTLGLPCCVHIIIHGKRAAFPSTKLFNALLKYVNHLLASFAVRNTIIYYPAQKVVPHVGLLITN